MIERLVNVLRTSPRFRDRIEYIHVLPIKEPIYGELKAPLPENIQAYLLEKGIKLYKHQSDAIESLREGKNVVITTPTASGKTLAFNIPIFEKLSLDKSSTALYLYPTKALSNDQLKVLKEFERITEINVKPNVYDGDTPSNKRPSIRATSRIIISNPYELHHVLPWHYKWQKFYRNLRFVVIDEAHHYRGVFGSNVAFLLRRFRRICNFYGANPQFILSTATLANPLEFSRKLVGFDFELIAEDGSPTGRKFFIFYNPYFDATGELSTHQETKDLFLHFVKNNLQTLCFTISRRMAELITLWSKVELKESDPDLVDKVTAYRAGYLPEERREIESNLKKGLLRGVASTNALELGIDIGSLDSVIISGYPGTIISTWQQAGRSGREINDSIAALVAFQNPLDQFFMNHPEVFFGKSHEHAIIDLSNPYIISGHLMCATSELPLELEAEGRYFGDDTTVLLEALETQGVIRNTPNGWVYSGKERATAVVNLNNISSDIFRIICDGKLLETMERAQAYREAHEGAVLLHQGETYLVDDFSLKHSLVQVKKVDVDFHTAVSKAVDIEVIGEITNKEIGKFAVSFGEVEVTEQYVNYKTMRYDKIIGINWLDLPPLTFKTMGLWFTVPEDLSEKIWAKRKEDEDIKEELNKTAEETLKQEIFAGALHGIEHAMIGLMPFHVMCDRWDIGGVSTPMHADTMNPTVFIYDGFEGGIGLTEKAFDFITEIIQMTFELVRDCKCAKGCPACIYSPKCGNENEPLDKKGTLLLLEELLGMLNVKSS